MPKCNSVLQGERTFFRTPKSSKNFGHSPVDPLNSITEEISVLQNMSGLRISISHKVKHPKFLEDSRNRCFAHSTMQTFITYLNVLESFDFLHKEA